MLVFSSKNAARAIDLKTILDLIKKCNLSLHEYFTQIKNLVDSLTAAGKKVSHEDHVMYILRGLGIEYDSTVSVLTGNEVFPPLSRVYYMLLTQENRLQRHSTQSILMVLYHQSIWCLINHRCSLLVVIILMVIEEGVSMEGE